ncbi:MAG: HIT domain-containing protein [Firmicutes bacterium]|nr:HIT domain-containing protein [Bacillota bacterium]
MDCIFCKIANKEISSNFVYEDDILMVIMDINPTCDGHLLVIPKEHFTTIFDVPEKVLAHMYQIAEQMTYKVMKATGEKGVTLSINYGDKQEIKHVHLHILPNFQTKASKSIEEVYKLLMEE